MFKQIRTINADLDALAEDVQSLINATANAADSKIVNARNRLDSLINNGERAYAKLEDTAVKTIKQTDKAVRSHPFRSLGMALGVGVALGAALYKRSK